MKEDVPGYEELRRILDLAYEQASEGKGKERHSVDKPFHLQPIYIIQDMVGEGFALGQCIKKVQESTRLPKDQALKEILGAIVYLAGAYYFREKN